MLIKNKPMNRRRVLRGVLGGGAVAVSLPFFDCFLNSNGTALAATNAPLPTRFGTWFWGLGMNGPVFIPKKVGADFDLPEEIAPLKDVKQHINLFTNFSIPTDGRPNLGHYSGWVALRCGSTPRGQNDLANESLDLPISRAIGAGSRFRLLNLSATGNPRDSYSFQSSDAINPTEISAVDAYHKIFGPDFQDPNSPTFTPDPRMLVRKSVLSSVLEEQKTLNNTLGASDKARLDQYFTSIRELEGRLEVQLQKPPPAPLCVVPSEVPGEISAGLDYELVEARHRAMTDLLAMALTCNQTRVFNMLYSDSGSNLTKKGHDQTHHNMTHEELIDEHLGYQVRSSWFLREAMKSFAYLIRTLAGQPEGDGSLLDHSLIYAHSDTEFAKTHNIDGSPMFTVGRANGRLKTGLHIDGKGEIATRLGYTVQRVMGLPIGEWGTASLRTSREIGEILG